MSNAKQAFEMAQSVATGDEVLFRGEWWTVTSLLSRAPKLLNKNYMAKNTDQTEGFEVLSPRGVSYRVSAEAIGWHL